MIDAIVITITENRITARRNSQILVSLTIPAAHALAASFDPENHEFSISGKAQAIRLNDDLAIQASIKIFPSAELLKKWDKEALDEES